MKRSNARPSTHATTCPRDDSSYHEPRVRRVYTDMDDRAHCTHGVVYTRDAPMPRSAYLLTLTGTYAQRGRFSLKIERTESERDRAQTTCRWHKKNGECETPAKGHSRICDLSTATPASGSQAQNPQPQPATQKHNEVKTCDVRMGKAPQQCAESGARYPSQRVVEWQREELGVIRSPEVRTRVERLSGNALTCLPACSNASAVVDRGCRGR